MNLVIDSSKNEEEINLLSPLVWAYIGDSVYEIYVRTNLVQNTNLKPHKLHIETTKKVKAQAQAETLVKIQDKLTEQEKEIVRRARNTKNHHLPKHANVQEYCYATALEALIGYLFLTEQEKRLQEIMRFCINEED